MQRKCGLGGVGRCDVQGGQGRLPACCTPASHGSLRPLLPVLASLLRRPLPSCKYLSRNVSQSWGRQARHAAAVCLTNAAATCAAAAAVGARSSSLPSLAAARPLLQNTSVGTPPSWKRGSVRSGCVGVFQAVTGGASTGRTGVRRRCWRSGSGEGARIDAQRVRRRPPSRRRGEVCEQAPVRTAAPVAASPLLLAVAGPLLRPRCSNPRHSAPFTVPAACAAGGEVQAGCEVGLICRLVRWVQGLARTCRCSHIQFQQLSPRRRHRVPHRLGAAHAVGAPVGYTRGGGWLQGRGMGVGCRAGQRARAQRAELEGSSRLQGGATGGGHSAWQQQLKTWQQQLRTSCAHISSV